MNVRGVANTPPEEISWVASPSAPWVPSLALGAAALGSSTGLWWAGYGAGLAPFPPFDLSDLMIRTMPGDVAVWAIANLQFNARRLAMAGGVLLVLAYGLLAGVALRRFPGSQPGAIIAALSSPLCVLLAFTNNQASGIGPAVGLFVWFAITLAIPLALAGHWIERLWLDAVDRADTASGWLDMGGQRARRDVLIQAAGGALAFSLGGWLTGSLFKSSGVGGVETGDGLPLGAVRGNLEAATEGTLTFPTPIPSVSGESDLVIPAGVRPRNTNNDDFYVVDITTRKPALSENSWVLKIHGLVDRPIDITYSDLLNMPAIEMDGTLMCISYTHGNDLISSTRWTGVPLRDVLQMSGIGDGAVDLVLIGAGGYSDSIPVSTALDEGTLLAYGMNGESLPREHGFPCRLYVPGIYGEKNVKWLEEIQVVDFDYRGYWQERGWTDDAVIRTVSVIDTPRGETARDAAGIVAVGGIAFAGSRGIREVRLQVDGGAWIDTGVEPYDPELVWQRWQYEWPADPGEYTLTIQAVDGEGTVQDTVEREPYPDGMTGLHQVQIRVL